MLPLGLYLVTAAPGTTGYDTPELTLGAVALGVPHPPGEPLWVMLGKLMTFLPLGSVAFRLTVFSALATASAAWLAGQTIRRLGPPTVCAPTLAPLVASLMLATALPIWLQAVRVEVYALHLLTVSLLGWLATHDRISLPQRLALGALVTGLGLANHHALIIAALPGLLLLLAGPSVRPGLSPQVWARAAGMLILGLGSYLALPIRTMAGALLATGHPDSIAAFWATITGAVYQRSFSGIDSQGLASNIVTHFDLLVSVYGVPTLAVAALGGVIISRTHLRQTAALGLVFLGTGATTTLQGVFTVENPDALGYLAGAAWAVALMTAAGARHIEAMVVRRTQNPALRALLAMTVSAVALSPAPRAWPRANHAHHVGSERYGALLLDSLPQGTILLTSTDSTSLTSAYHQGVLGRRMDVVLIPQYHGPATAGSYHSPSLDVDATALLDGLRIGGTGAVQATLNSRPIFINASAHEGAFRTQLRPGLWAQRLIYPDDQVAIDAGYSQIVAAVRAQSATLSALAEAGDRQTLRLYKENLEAVGDALLELGSLQAANRAYGATIELGISPTDIARLKIYHSWHALGLQRERAKAKEPLIGVDSRLRIGFVDGPQARLHMLAPADRAWAEGRIQWLKGDAEGSKTAWRRALGIAPDHQEALIDMATWGDASLAATLIKAQAGPSPSPLSMAVALSRALRRLGQPLAAMDALSMHSATSPQAQCEIALAHEMEEDWTAASQALATCLTERRWDPEAGRLLTRLRMRGMVIDAQVTPAPPEGAPQH